MNDLTEGLFQKSYEGVDLDKELKRHFGFDKFRLYQKETIEKLLRGERCLTVLPTGTGKSLIYQLSALIVDGVAIVISPLIVLMEDQVNAFNKLFGEDQAVYLNSSLTEKRRKKNIALIKEGKVKLIYLAPETMKNAEVGPLLKGIGNISFVAIDEAHVLSSWGMDFRKSYRLIPQLIERLKVSRVVALTATAPKKVRDDVGKLLNINVKNIVVASSNRPNLSYEVRDKGGSTINEISEIIEETEEGATLIYCNFTKETEILSAVLNRRGHNTKFFHGKLGGKARSKILKEFLDNEINVVIATNAFGMGVDKPNIRNVIHYQVPQSIENYSQETGRAGRDGEPSQCVLFYKSTDVGKLRWLIGIRSNDALNPHRLLDAMQSLAETPEEDFRTRLINYFK